MSADRLLKSSKMWSKFHRKKWRSSIVRNSWKIPNQSPVPGRFRHSSLIPSRLCSYRLVRLKAKQDEEPAPTTTHTIDQNQTLTTLPAAATANTALVYPPNPNLRTVGYIQSDIPPHVMFASQQQQQPTAQMPTQTSLFPAPMPVSYPTQQPLTIPGANIYGYQQYWARQRSGRRNCDIWHFIQNKSFIVKKETHCTGHRMIRYGFILIFLLHWGHL